MNKIRDVQMYVDDWKVLHLTKETGIADARKEGHEPQRSDHHKRQDHFGVHDMAAGCWSATRSTPAGCRETKACYQCWLRIDALVSVFKICDYAKASGANTGANRTKEESEGNHHQVDAAANLPSRYQSNG